MEKQPRERWRMPLSQLCYRVRATPPELDRWAAAGALGPRMKETTEGRWRHITKEEARNAVVTRILLDHGLTLKGAADLVNEDRVVFDRGDGVFYMRIKGLTVDINPDDLEV